MSGTLQHLMLIWNSKGGAWQSDAKLHSFLARSGTPESTPATHLCEEIGKNSEGLFAAIQIFEAPYIVKPLIRLCQ
jgi:hypothetical protein